MTREPVERFRERFFQDESGCWIWHGATGGGKVRYGVFSAQNRKLVVAHRWSYEYFVGPIPAGLVIDHLCKVSLCVNPDHLEPVTQRENLMRSDTLQARNAAKTRCPQGHPYDEENTRLKKGRGGMRRVCKKCEATQGKARRAAMPKMGRPTGERSGSARLTWAKVREIRKLAAAGVSRIDLARQFSVTVPTIRSIVINKSWIE